MIVMSYFGKWKREALAEIGINGKGNDHGLRWHNNDPLPQEIMGVYEANQFLYWYLYEATPEQMGGAWGQFLVKLVGRTGFSQTIPEAMSEVIGEAVVRYCTAGEKLVTACFLGLAKVPRVYGDWFTVMVPMDWNAEALGHQGSHTYGVFYEWEPIFEGEEPPTESFDDAISRADREFRENSVNDHPNQTYVHFNMYRTQKYKDLYAAGKVKPRVIKRKSLRVRVTGGVKQKALAMEQLDMRSTGYEWAEDQREIDRLDAIRIEGQRRRRAGDRFEPLSRIFGTPGRDLE